MGVWLSPAGADSLPEDCAQPPMVEGVVAAVDDHADIVLTNGERLRLADVHLPRRGEERQLSRDLLQHLRGSLVDKSISYYETGRRDRYDRLPVHLFTADQQSVQRDLMHAALAVFLPDPMTKKNIGLSCYVKALTGLLLEDERKARHSHEQLASAASVFDAESGRLWAMRGEFAIVQGVITDIKVTKRGAFVNFGEDWKQDFTAVLSKPVMLSFENQKKILSRFVGKRVQVRGFLDLYNGPSMRIDHLAQMEFISE